VTTEKGSSGDLRTKKPLCRGAAEACVIRQRFYHGWRQHLNVTHLAVRDARDKSSAAARASIRRSVSRVSWSFRSERV
jgi:hypothetical protein